MVAKLNVGHGILNTVVPVEKNLSRAVGLNLRWNIAHTKKGYSPSQKEIEVRN